MTLSAPSTAVSVWLARAMAVSYLSDISIRYLRGCQRAAASTSDAGSRRAQAGERSQPRRSRGSLCFGCHRHYDVSPFVPTIDVPVSLDDLLQGIAPVDD